ncbi:Cytochrome c-552 precursor (Cytochrome c552) [Herminiimonas arsenicoxydans]|uniref:AoxD n=1 Tax=Herminiimonas arsenicoxydans TaxID=204773 RepID=Q8GGJ4_HERAR|nr:AoxD [Herminiimonas arsenicoxydans]CAL60688.1 Cytochrome c-552 precursor (Cytochrome c552) [Herminiimonas arsenicoxydans]
MKYAIAICIFSLSFSASAAADANKAKGIAVKSACMACHGTNNKIVGPGFNEIANKYKGNKTAVSTLVKKIKVGGSGVWGTTPMPPNNLSEADAKLVVEWILAGAK